MLIQKSILSFVFLGTLSVVNAQLCLTLNDEFLKYDDSEICCNGSVHPKSLNGKKQNCCNGTKLFFIDEEVCCDGVYYRKSASDAICCGKRLITNQDESICCDEKVYPADDYYCDRGVALLKDEIACFDEYNKTDYDIYSEKDSYDCCGKSYISESDSEKCKNGVFISLRDKHKDTCGSRTFNFYEYVCCEETQTLMKIPGNIRYAEGVAPNIECVKGQLIDKYTNEIVRTGNDTKIIPKGHKMCGDASFPKTLHEPVVRCCNENINYDIHGSNVQCCGNETIDLDQYICCNEKKYPKKKLCCGHKHPYERDDRDTLCCNGEIISAETHLCCDGTKYHVGKGNMYNQCCGRRIYNSLENNCCDQTIVNLTHTCSNNNVQTIPPKFHGPVRHNERVLKIFVEGCSTCPMDLSPDIACTKRFEYRFYVKDIYKNGRAMDVVFLSPRSLEGFSITLRSRSLCSCIQKDSAYAMFSNRDYRQKVISQIFTLSFSKRDIFSKLQMKNNRMTPAITCKIDRYYKPHRS
ncbi:hypothetical protein ACF0H5_001984 [Mactra antiquata]